MRAAILAGGKGTRIGGLYPNLPKPMIPVCGKPLLQLQIESLAEQGITDITLIVGYKADIIRRHFNDGDDFSVHLRYIAEDTPLGTGGALPLLPKDDTLIIYGDVYFDIDIERFIRHHKSSGVAVTLFAHPNNHPYDSDIVVTDERNVVTAWMSKKDSNRGDVRNLVNAGLYVFNADSLPAGDAARRDLEHEIIMPMLPGSSVSAYRSTEYVKDMGTPERLAEVEEAVSGGLAKSRCLRNKQRAVFIDRDGTINVQRGHINEPEQIELIPGAAEAIRKLNESPYLTICVTNQPVVARGMATFSGLGEINARLDTLLGQQGAYLDDLFYCPHHPDGGYPEEVPSLKFECDCRKPKPGMLLDAAERYNIDLSCSYMIGDSTADIAAGNAAGCKTIGVKTGRGLGDGKCRVDPDLVFANLREAAEYITYNPRIYENC